MSAAPSDPPHRDPPSSALSLLEQVAAAGLWLLEPDSGRMRWSPQLARLLGWDGPHPPPDTPPLAFLAPSWRAPVESLLQRCVQEGEPFDCEAQVALRSGRRVWARVLAQAVRDGQGRVLRVEGAVQPITPRPAGPEALATVDGEGRFSYLNEEAERLLGQDATVLLGRRLSGLFQMTARQRIEEALQQARSRPQPLELEAPDASQTRWLALHGRPFGPGLAIHLRDVTAHHRSQEQLRLLEGSIARLNDIVIITEAGPFNEPGPRIVFVNEAFERRTGYRRDEVLGRSPRLLQGPRTQRDRLDRVRSALEQWQPVRVDLVNYRKDGSAFWVDLDISPVWDPARRLTHWVAVGRDVTERKAAEQKIRWLAFYDGLTGLPNRQQLLERLQQALEPRGGAQGGALMFIDLDNFKVLNDTLGHQKGDLLLQQVAQRLRACVAEDDTVARLGGDEFVILLQPRAGPVPAAARAAAAAVAERILAALGEPYALGGHLHHSTSSIGVAVFGPAAGPVGELLKQADLAMYQAKRAGRNTVCFFDPQLQALASASAALAADLRRACHEGQFRLEFQPQVDGQGRVAGVEALMRWQSPHRGEVPPALFIAAAEETSLILALGRWALQAACEQLARWARRPDRCHLSLSVNVSARQFRQVEFVDEVVAGIERAGIAPNRLKRELTETLLADAFDATVARMDRLRRMGVALSLDDFGMGYSSLAYLKRLPLDQLKIDRAFVKDVLTDASDAAIVRTIIDLAQSLGLEVVAEGVECPAQRDFLLAQGCRQFQGFLFSPPLPGDALEAYIDAHRA